MSHKQMPIIVIVLGMAIPTIIAWIYFDLLATAPAIAQQSAYALGKLSQVGIMLVAFWIWRQRQKEPKDKQSIFGKPICMRSIARSAMRVPFANESSPEVRVVSRTRIRNSVVLPAPFGPASASRSRRRSVNETPSNRGSPPSSLRSPDATSTATGEG